MYYFYEFYKTKYLLGQSSFLSKDEFSAVEVVEILLKENSQFISIISMRHKLPAGCNFHLSVRIPQTLAQFPFVLLHLLVGLVLKQSS